MSNSVQDMQIDNEIKNFLNGTMFTRGLNQQNLTEEKIRKSRS